MAEDMAKRVSVFVERTKRIKYVYPAVLSFEYEERPDLNYKKFDCESIEWAKFIMANRVTPAIAKEMGLTDSNIDLKYDIIMGGTADGNVAGIASDLRFGRMNPSDYVFRLSDFLKNDGSSYGTQIVFCTDRAVSCIEYMKCDIIKER